MVMGAQSFFCSGATALLLIICSCASTLAKGTTTSGVVRFSYTGASAPDKWGSLSPNFTACSNGKYQSPINIVKHRAVVNKKLKPLAEQFHSHNATLVDNGFNVGLRYANNTGVANIDGKKYSLKQMHWHAPSEHRIDGLQYAAELHLVHMTEEGSVSVVAILYRYGRPDPLLARIQGRLTQLAKEAAARGEEAAEITLDPSSIDTHELKKHARKYYRYTGSFTTPPCTEGVLWNIMAKVRSISREQVEALRAPLSITCKKNARPLQPLHGRRVELYMESRSPTAT